MLVYPQTYPHNHICTATSLPNFHLYGLGFQAFQNTLRRPALCPQKKSTASAGLLFGVNPVLLPVSEAAPHVSTKNTSTPPGRTAKSQSAGQYVTRPAEGCNVAFDDNTASHCQYTSRSSNAVKLRFLYASAYKNTSSFRWICTVKTVLSKKPQINFFFHSRPCSFIMSLDIFQ